MFFRAGRARCSLTPKQQLKLRLGWQQFWRRSFSATRNGSRNKFRRLTKLLRTTCCAPEVTEDNLAFRLLTNLAVCEIITRYESPGERLTGANPRRGLLRTGLLDPKAHVV